MWFSCCDLDLNFNNFIVLCSDLIHEATNFTQLNNKANKSRTIHVLWLKILLIIDHLMPHDTQLHMLISLIETL